jgi:hypothetical protein
MAVRPYAIHAISFDKCRPLRNNAHIGGGHPQRRAGTGDCPYFCSASRRLMLSIAGIGEGRTPFNIAR